MAPKAAIGAMAAGTLLGSGLPAIPLLALGGSAAWTAVLVVAVSIGYFYQKYNITGRMNSHFNRTMNPEINDIHQDIKLIKKQLGIPEVKR